MGYPGRVDLARLRGRLPLPVFLLPALVCLALLGLACACLGEQPAQALERAVSVGAALPPLVAIWALLVASLSGAPVLFGAAEPARSRASPAALQCFRF